jgi:hypothetical protein
MRRGLTLVLVLLLGAALLGGGTWWYAVRTLRAQIVAALGPGTEVAAVTLHAGHVEIAGLRVAAPAGWPSPDALSATRVVVVPELRTLLSAHPRIARVSIEGAYLSVLRTGDGRVRMLPGLTEPSSARPREAPASPAAQPKSSATPAVSGAKAAPAAPSVDIVTIGRIVLQDGALDFFDASVGRPPHRLRIEALTASVSDLDVPRLAGRSAVALAGTVKAAAGRSPAKDGSLEIEGWLVPAAGDSRLVARLRRVDLVVLQPYLLRAADARVRGGTLDLDLNSVVTGGQLRAPGTVSLTGLELGPAKGGAATFMGLPRDAVLRLMADRAGRIQLDFVLQGRLDDPSFSLSEDLATRATAAIAGSLGIGVEGIVRGAEGAGQKAIDAATGALRRLFER